MYSDFKIRVRLTNGDNGPRSQMDGLQNGLGRGSVQPPQMKRKWKSENAYMSSEAHQNPYFVWLYCIYIYIDKHIFNYKIVNKIAPHFVYFFRGGGAAERKWWKENVNHKCLDDF